MLNYTDNYNRMILQTVLFKQNAFQKLIFVFTFWGLLIFHPKMRVKKL